MTSQHGTEDGDAEDLNPTDVREYVVSMATELSHLARAIDDEQLAVALEQAAAVASRKLQNA
ncbi:hypothetical protein [Brevundimonas faecalis]|uniref:DUF2783 domain-containing protein n=1 Tax=Brevundimonas faecalis TaxID=947378 RepID=A0ABV2RDP8_9CAUL